MPFIIVGQVSSKQEALEYQRIAQHFVVGLMAKKLARKSLQISRLESTLRELQKEV